MTLTDHSVEVEENLFDEQIVHQGQMLLRNYEGDKKKFIVLDVDNLQIFDKDEDFGPTEDRNSSPEMSINVANSTCKVV